MSLLLACGDDDSGSGYADLSTASIADAAIIYQRTGMTRSASGGEEDEGYWKIDRQGNETKILLYDKAGNPTDVKIEKIEKLNDKLLLIETRSYLPRMIADLQTEKLYQAPGILDTPVKEGPDGKLYFVGQWIDAVNNQMLYRLDPTNFTVEQVLPDEQKCNSFLINKGSAIYYTPSEDLLHGGGKIKMPSGRIYPISDVVFLAGNSEFYSIDLDQPSAIFGWKQKSNNELEKSVVCSLFEEGLPDQFSREITCIVQNRRNNSTVMFMPTYISGQIGYKLYEFDGSRIIRTKTYDQDNNESYRASTLWWNIGMGNNKKESLANDYLLFTGSEILTLSLNDYTIKSTPYTFPDNEYELYETTMDEANSRQLFTALRYEDGKVVIGEISAQGRISIINEKESNSKIINLIALN